MRLANDQEEGHVSPGKLGKLKPVVSLLKRTNEEYETWNMLDTELAVNVASLPIMYNMKLMNLW